MTKVKSGLQNIWACMRSKAGKVWFSCCAFAVTCCTALAAFAEETTVALAADSSEAVSAAQSLLESATGTLNISNIVAIVGAGIGAVIGLFLAWWGARKLVRMLMAAFKKGKVSM